MYLIKTKDKPSPIAGKGYFAGEEVLLFRSKDKFAQQITAAILARKKPNLGKQIKFSLIENG